MAERLDLSVPSELACLGTGLLLLVTVISAGFLLVGFQRLLKPVLVGMVMLSSVLSYFTQELGIVFDKEMIHNVAETVRDRNQQEALELLSLALVAHVIVYGILPSALILILRQRRQSLTRQVLSHAGYLGGLLLLVVLAVFANFKTVSYFARANRDLRFYGTPAYALASLNKYLVGRWGSTDEPFVVLGEDAHQVKSQPSRTVGIMVVGETARSDHFSLNGYARTTNPLLAQRDVLSYTEVYSSGTSTAYCVPFMFSFLGQGKYSTKRAARQSNVLDVLCRAGVRVVWIDNNSSSKGVCARIGSVNLLTAPVRDSPHNEDGGYYDEVLLEDLDAYIADPDGDVLIVLHTMGSHGPAYHNRYPPAFERFTPACKQDAPQSCSDEELVNAYDNTILYTDKILDDLIGFLETLDEDSQSFLLYASDHGESLGEGGVYLHGLPAPLAPKSQTHVPMIAWLSPLLRARLSTNYADIQGRVGEQTSHEVIAPTLLSLFEVRTSLYRPKLNIFR